MVSAIATSSAATTSSNVNSSSKTTTKGTTSKSEKFSSFIDNIKKANEKTSETTSASDTSNAKSDSNNTAEKLVKEIKSTFKDVSTCPKCGAIYIGEAPPAICTKCGTSIEQHINGKQTDETKDTKSGNTDSSIQSTQLETDTSSDTSTSLTK